MPTHTLTAPIITAAIEGFELQKRRVDGQIAELRAMLPGGIAVNDATPDAAPRKRKRLSAAARKRMGDAQRLRWAKIRGESQSPTLATAQPAKPKRRISEEGMKRTIAARKKRWRLQKAAAKAKSAASKKTVAKKATVKTAPARAAKKALLKRTATASALGTTETAAQ